MKPPDLLQKVAEICLSLPEATREDANGHGLFAVRGKKFAYFKTSDPERWRFSIRVAPDRFIELTDVPGVKPARYRGRFYWITIVNVSSFPALYLKELVEWSYQRAFKSVSKAKQAGSEANWASAPPPRGRRRRPS